MAMTRREFRKLAVLRLREARCLLRAGHHDGAYYLAGYCVECALKACIARKTKQYDFPDKAAVNASWTHKLDDLVRAAGLDPQLRADERSDPVLAGNWSIVLEWAESKRYELGRSKQEAFGFYEAVTADKSGVLMWIRQYW